MNEIIERLDALEKEVRDLKLENKSIKRSVSSVEQKFQELRVSTDKGEVSLADPSYNLSRRALNVLERAKCGTVSDLRRFGVENIRNVYGCGHNTYLEIKQIL